MAERRLCRLEEVPEGGARGLSADGRELILLRRGGRVLAWRNRCPHTGVNLEWQPDQFFDREGRFLQCATHGALFRPEDGYCVRGPCAGDALEAIPVEIRDGWVHLAE